MSIYYKAVLAMEELPEKSGEYFVIHNGNEEVAWFNAPDKIWQQTGDDINRVTHWLRPIEVGEVLSDEEIYEWAKPICSYDRQLAVFGKKKADMTLHFTMKGAEAMRDRLAPLLRDKDAEITKPQTEEEIIDAFKPKFKKTDYAIYCDNLVTIELIEGAIPEFLYWITPNRLWVQESNLTPPITAEVMPDGTAKEVNPFGDKPSKDDPTILAMYAVRVHSAWREAERNRRTWAVEYTQYSSSDFEGKKMKWGESNGHVVEPGTVVLGYEKDGRFIIMEVESESL